MFYLKLLIAYDSVEHLSYHSEDMMKEALHKIQDYFMA